MKRLRILILSILAMGVASQSHAYEYYENGSAPDIEVWVNKGPNSTYYYGEDIAIYFRAEQDCYVVIYDIDPSGEVTILYPASPFGSTFATRENIYRIPDQHADYGLEVSSVSGTNYVFAFASYDYINPPDFMRYIGYEYGDPDYYDDNYFVMTVRGDIDEFVDYVSGRLAKGPYTVTHTKFFVNARYRHHVHYRYWDPDPYYVGSVWVGCEWPGAEIWIDGIYYGIAPVLIPSIYWGHHWVWVYYGGYPCYQRYFYIGSYNRFYIHVTIDDRYRDYRHRRHAFRDWRFHERRHRNEEGFREKAVRARQNKVRTRSLPASMVMDLQEKGAIRSGAPIVKNARADIRERTERKTESRVRVNEQEKGERVRQEIRVENRAERKAASDTKAEPKRSKAIDRPEGARYQIKSVDVDKSPGKSSEARREVKSEKKSRSVKSESRESKSSTYEKRDNKSSSSSSKKSKVKSSGSSNKKIERKSSGSSSKKIERKSSSSKKSSSNKMKSSGKSSKSSKSSDSDRGKRRW
ncbi:MAG: DUF4384 domain-containing protein [Candidatus Zixiibacteriota bacterium]|nr:MAG: DUF4384 domain-containing protein [candidate division Zixibacteria bacterium]